MLPKKDSLFRRSQQSPGDLPFRVRPRLTRQEPSFFPESHLNAWVQVAGSAFRHTGCCKSDSGSIFANGELEDFDGGIQFVASSLGPEELAPR